VPTDAALDLVPVDAEFLAKHKPEAGGFLVIYQDGYKSFSPAKAFMEGYALVGSPPAAAEPTVATAQVVGAQVRPTIGRIVIYNHPGSADGKYPPSQSPAIIQNVAADGSVRLFVFGPKGQHMDDGLTQGDGPCQWNWPPRG
jgi:hypothetical protein